MPLGADVVLLTLSPATVPLNPSSAAFEVSAFEKLVRARTPVLPRKVIVSPDATVPSSLSVVVGLSLLILSPVAPLAMLPVISSVPPEASMVPAPDSAPVSVPEPMIVPLVLVRPPAAFSVPPSS